MMRSECKCGANLTVKKRVRVSEDLTHFYGDCKSCGRSWRGSMTLDHEVKSPEASLKAKLLSAFEKYSPEEQLSLIDQLDPA